ELPHVQFGHGNLVKCTIVRVAVDRRQAETFEAGGCENDPVEITVTKAAQSRIYVAAQWQHLKTWANAQRLQTPANRRSTESRSRCPAQRCPTAGSTREQEVVYGLAPRDCDKTKLLRQNGRQVLHRMDGGIDSIF